MIKPEDLRIGNLFEYKTSEGWEPNIIDWEDIKHCVEFNKSFNESYRPIPLTEKILLDCGFTKDGLFVGEFVYTKSKYFYSMDLKVLFVIVGHNGEVLNYEGYEVQTSDSQTLYLHDLQNLFYSLNKTELIIKL